MKGYETNEIAIYPRTHFIGAYRQGRYQGTEGGAVACPPFRSVLRIYLLPFSFQLERGENRVVFDISKTLAGEGLLCKQDRTTAYENRSNKRIFSTNKRERYT